MAGQVKIAFEIAKATIGVLGNLGLKVDIFSDDSPDLAAKIDELELKIDAGFFNNQQNQAILQIGEALQLSSQAWAEFKNVGLTPERKAALLQNAAEGLSNMSNAIDTLLKVEGSLVPNVVQEMYTALAFSTTVLIRTATSLASGEQTGTGYNHGGVITYESQIATAVDHLESARDLFKDEYTFTVSAPQKKVIFESDVTGLTTGIINFTFTHNIPLTNDLAYDFFSGFLKQFGPSYANLNFRDPNILTITEDHIVFSDPKNYQFAAGSFLGDRIDSPHPEYNVLIESAYTRLANEFAATLDDYTYFFLTGLTLPSPPPIAQSIDLNFYEEGVDVLGDLVDSAKATIDGEVVSYNGVAREQAEQGTAGGTTCRAVCLTM